MKQLGIIIPAYNVERSLQNLLNTLVQQITDDVEVIVIDDGSQDNTLATASRFANENISVIHQDNQGVGKARNRGIETCKAEYLWFVDADDNIRPDAVPALLNAIRQESFDCYLFGLEKVRGHRVTQIVNASDTCLTSNEAIAGAFDTIFSENLLNPLWNKLFRRSVIEQHQIRFSSIPSGEDAEFVLHYLTYADSMHVLPMVLYQYTLMSATSSSHAYHPSYIADHVQMFGALAEYCAATGAMADNVKKQWQRETYLGACQNIFNSLLPKPSYQKFAKELRRQLPELRNLILSIYVSKNDERRYCNALICRLMGYLIIKYKHLLNNMR
jgi:glycosyltransferase involved in cell wall biosynthesis